MVSDRRSPALAAATLLVSLLLGSLVLGSLTTPAAGSPARESVPPAETPAATSAQATAPQPQAAVQLKPALKKVLARVNQVRAAHGRKPLRVTACLTAKVAQPWARHLAKVERLYHQDLSKVFRTCPGLTMVGENIAYGYATPQAVMNAWMHSRGHRRNILNRKFRKIGLGLARTTDGTPYWVQDFGR